MSVKLLTSGGGGVVLTPSSSIASDQTMYLPVSGVSGGTVVCSDSNGNVGIGTSSPASKLHLYGADPRIRFENPSWSKTYYIGSDQNNLVFVDVSSNAVRMRLDSSGNLLVGTATPNYTAANGFGVVQASSSTYIFTNHLNGTSTGAWYHSFGYNGSQIGCISQNGTTAVTYSTTSDHRLKTNVRDADAKSFGNVKFRDFEWVDGRHDCGVIAHELQEVYPDLVLGEKDATEIRTEEITPAEYETITIPAVLDAEGNEVEPERTEQKLIKEAVTEDKEYPVYQQVNYMGLICRMGTVIQQQAKAIESLTERIAALEGA